MMLLQCIQKHVNATELKSGPKSCGWLKFGSIVKNTVPKGASFDGILIAGFVRWKGTSTKMQKRSRNIF